jgi:hypothetical protein
MWLSNQLSEADLTEYVHTLSEQQMTPEPRLAPDDPHETRGALSCSDHQLRLLR